MQTTYSCTNLGGEQKPELGTEQACTNYCSSTTSGCCSTDCHYGLASTCDSSTNFYQNIQCSKVSSCKEQCLAHHHKQCGDDGSAYWYDSCGNREETAQLCDPDGRHGPSTQCLAQDTGEVRCQSTDCATTWDNPVVDEAGTTDGGDSTGADLTNDHLVRKNRDSWCEYQAAVGPTLDLPGTQHYRHYCERGQEKVDPCGPDRSRICIYGSVQLTPTDAKAMGICAPNKGESCVACNDQNCCEDPNKKCVWLSSNKEEYKQKDGKITAKIPLTYDSKEKELLIAGERESFSSPDAISKAEFRLRGSESKTLSFSQATKTSSKNIDTYLFQMQLSPGDYTLLACEKSDTKDDNCVIIAQKTITADSIKELTQGKGYCVPFVPPARSSQCTTINSKLVYPKAAYWEEACIGTDWSCTEGCDVYNNDFKKGTNSLCNAYGDCGAKYNLAGVFSSTGYQRDCSPGGASYKDINTQCPAGSGVIPPGTINFEEYKYAKMGLNILHLDMTALSEQGTSTTTILAYSLGGLGGLSLVAGYVGATIAVGLAGAGTISFQAALSAIGYVVSFGSVGGPVGLIIGVIVILVIIAAAVFFYSCSPNEYRDIAVSCSAWQPPRGGADCWKCHTPQSQGGLLPDAFAFNYTGTGPLPQYDCTEQLCGSLGSFCQLTDTPQGPRCVSNDPQNVVPPNIAVKNVVFTCNDEVPGQVGNCNLEKDGKVVVTGELKEFSSVNITLTTMNADATRDEVAACHYALGIEHRDDTFENMKPLEVGNTLSTTHSLSFANIGQNKTINAYILCQDLNKNTMTTPLPITFTSARQPDKTPPTITRFYPSIAYTPALATTFPLTIETNEDVPLGTSGGCRWSSIPNTPFNHMNYMDCSSGTLSLGPTCSTTLTNINQTQQTFYFRCQDTAEPTHNIMQQDLLYSVQKTSALTLNDLHCITPLGNTCDPTMYGTAFNLTLTTQGGYAQGTSVCTYQLDRSVPIEFFVTNTTSHQQPGIRPTAQDHILAIHCADTIGNIANTTLAFTFMQDTTAPHILRATIDDHLLRVLTDEKAMCNYATNTTASSYIPFATTQTIMHATPLPGNTFFMIQCEDIFHNTGSPTKITIL